MGQGQILEWEAWLTWVLVDIYDTASKDPREWEDQLSVRRSTFDVLGGLLCSYIVKLSEEGGVEYSMTTGCLST